MREQIYSHFSAVMDKRWGIVGIGFIFVPLLELIFPVGVNELELIIRSDFGFATTFFEQ